MKKFENDKEFKLRNVEIFEKGDLKGYMSGTIEFTNEQEHEFLYRIEDVENGDSFKLVSIDYGYNNPMVDRLWDQISSYCKELYNYRLYRKETNFTCSL